MGLFKKLRQKLDYIDERQIDQIHRAYLMALEAHQGQKRHTGEAYISHPVAVAYILAEMRLDYQTIMAALLHDILEDTAITKDNLIKDFGQSVANLVDGVTKLTQIEFVSRAEAQAENFRKMVLAMARDIRVILIKLADRLHNMRTLSFFRPEKQRRIAQETLEIFAPVAKRLGMRALSVELEELSFRSMYPRRYAILSEAVTRARGHRKKILNLIHKTLQEGLAKSNLASFTVVGREKHLYSIYEKMRAKRIPFNEIMDVYAFRIIVDDVDTCYRALGVVHSLFKPVPERFKDYVAISKANGYQSLHTTLFGPYGVPIEVQIRTTEMDHMAISGIAAHWLYKSDEKKIGESQMRAQQWVQNLLELQRSTGSSLEFIESVKVDLFPDEVYVFTPHGEIMALPMGATALDFAYAVHTDVGNSCIAIKIDRQLAPLSTMLANGQTIEVITATYGRPNPAWLDFVVTSKARSSIRHFLKTQRKTESIALGKKLLKTALQQQGFLLRKIPQEKIDFVLKEAQLSSLNDLFVEIGLGHRMAAVVAQRLANFMKDQPVMATTTPLSIMGTEGVVVQFSECCCPIPGDPIVGIINSGKGLLIHTEQCKRIEKIHESADRYMPLRWSDEIKREFPVMIQVEAIDKPRLLASLASAISDANANIEDIQVKGQAGSHYRFIFKLAVINRYHLASVFKNLRKVDKTIRILRGSAPFAKGMG